MVVTDEVKKRMDQRRAPLGADHVRADDDVAELARHASGQRGEPVDREGERIGRLVHTEMLLLEGPALLRPDEREPELARADAFACQHRARELDYGRFVHRGARTVDDFDLDQRLRWVPVCSACRLYASTIRCTSLWRTTS